MERGSRMAASSRNVIRQAVGDRPVGTGILITSDGNPVGKFDARLDCRTEWNAEPEPLEYYKPYSTVKRPRRKIVRPTTFARAYGTAGQNEGKDTFQFSERAKKLGIKF